MELLNQESSSDGSENSSPDIEVLNSINAVKVKSWGTIQTVKNYIAQKVHEEEKEADKKESEITEKRADTLDPRITSYKEGTINSTIMNRTQENNVNDPPEITAVNAAKVASWEAVNAAKEYGAEQAEKAKEHKPDN
uniref:Uncharacterized protein n=1 Tax=Panagrolaimus davidi TaxID=227884 RepID=A0A914QGR4_9BILA